MRRHYGIFCNLDGIWDTLAAAARMGIEIVRCTIHQSTIIPKNFC